MRKMHTNTAFDRDMRELDALILSMASKVEAAIVQATDAFARHDNELAAKVVQEDSAIDALEHEINLLVVRMLALRQPVASDLLEVITVMKVAGDLERLGDYAKNLGKRVPVLTPGDVLDSAIASVSRLSALVQAMLKDVVTAYSHNDTELAQAVLARDVEVDQVTNAMFREFLTHMMEDARNITLCMHVLFIAKNFERMGDHITEIAEQVIFAETGQLPTARVKGASTSTISGPLDEGGAA